MLYNRSLSVRLNGFIIYWPVKIDKKNEEPRHFNYKWMAKYIRMSKKKIPLNFLHWKFHFLAAFVNIHINSNDSCFFLFVYLNACMLLIYQERQGFSHAIFSKSSVHISSVFFKKYNFLSDHGKWSK